MRVAIVAGEASGDILGAGLIRALKAQYPDIQFEGIAGPQMMAEGMDSLIPMERLSVMGLVEVLGRLRELLGIRKRLRERWINHPPDVFIGIDAPDFNIPLARSLKAKGIKTVHYVCPSVWAWRQGRIKKIAQAVDQLLCLLPFEPEYFKATSVDARFIGHTLADQLPLEVDTQEARQALELKPDGQYLALLPGSRGGEVERLAPLFFDTASLLLQHKPALKFIVPAANQNRRQQIETLLAAYALPVQVIDGRSREVMAAADAVLMASGTAALEGMLLKKPLVVAYRMAPLSYKIISRMLKVPYVSLPNLLANEMLVPELLQDAATPEALAQALIQQLDDPERQAALQARFTELHRQMKLNASEQAAKAVLELVGTLSKEKNK